MASGFLDGVKFVPASSGTGDFVVSSAVTGYQTPASASAVNGTLYYYRAESTDLTQWEIGVGAYTVSTTTLARTTILFSSTGSKVSFSVAPNVSIVEAAEQLSTFPVVSGPTPFSPTDQSGASLSFTAVSVQWYQIGNMVFVYGSLTYPATASASNSKISLPVAVPNQNYAQAVGPLFNAGVGGAPIIIAVKNTSTAGFLNGASGTYYTNIQLTGAALSFTLAYPAS